MCLRHRSRQEASEEQDQRDRLFVQKLLDQCEYLEHTAPLLGYRYNRIWVGWHALAYRLRDVLQGSVESWPEVLAKFLFTLFYADPEVEQFLARHESVCQYEQEQVSAQLANCQEAQQKLSNQLQVVKAELQTAQREVGRLRQEMEAARKEIAHLTGLLHSRDAHIHTQNQVIAKLRDEVLRLQGSQ